jgi:hypothetical protein
MSGAAGIAAAKNRRTKPDPNQQPIISCSSKSGSCPLPPGKAQITSKSQITSKAQMVDPTSLQINGPLPIMQVLQVHEQRLNKFDDKLSKLSLGQGALVQCTPQSCEPQACDAECYDRLSTLEEKVQMLEEVIMNLQLTLTNVQSFAMETSLAMLKLQNISRPATPPPVSTVLGPESDDTVSVTAPATPAPATPAPAPVVSLPTFSKVKPTNTTTSSNIQLVVS